METIAGGSVTDLLLEKMFRARRFALSDWAVLAGLSVALWVNGWAHLLTDRGELVLIVAILGVLLAIYVAALVICYYVFRIGLRERGVGYTTGHVVLFIALSLVPLIGVVFVPLLIRSDVDRWRRSAKGIGGAATTPGSGRVDA